MVGDPHDARVLEGRDPLADEADQPLRRGGPPGTQHHGGGDLLAVDLVRYPDDGRLGDRRVGVEDLLHLARVDVAPAADDQVLDAVHDPEVPRASRTPRSPVCSQPSRTASAVARGRRQ